MPEAARTVTPEVHVPARPPAWHRRMRVVCRTALPAALLAALRLVAVPTAQADTQVRPPVGTATRLTWVQDASCGVLPAATAAAAWSRRNAAQVVLGDCAGAHCITVELLAVADCQSEGALGPAIGGCAVPGPDGACTAQIAAWMTAYPDALRAALEHEVGHCLGLPHNATDRCSIMSPTLPLMDPPSGPDSGDLADLRALPW